MSCLWGGADCCWRGESGGCAGGDMMGVVELFVVGKGAGLALEISSLRHSTVFFTIQSLVLRGAELYHRSIRYTRSKH